MNIAKIIISMLIISNLIYSSAYAIVAGEMAMVTRSWPVLSRGYDSMEFTITITAEPGYNGHTYWVHQFRYSDTTEGGHLGLQQRNGKNKFITFFIGGARGWIDSQYSSCGSVTHEKPGVQCDMVYNWKEGVTYKLRINRSEGNLWTATIDDTKRDQTTTIATIFAPARYGGLSGSSEWVGNFAHGSNQPATCEDVPKAIAVYGVPTVNNSLQPTSSISRTYGNCERIARAECSTEQVCILSVKPSTPIERKSFRNGAHRLCLDLLNGGTAAGLWSCIANNNQVFSQDTSYRIFQVSAPSHCLSVNAKKRVVTETCNNSAKQKWLRINRTSAYFNANANQCLDALNNGVLNSPLRLYQCQENVYQRWTPIP